VKKESKMLIGAIAVLLVSLPVISSVIADNDVQSDELNNEGGERFRRLLAALKLQQERRRLAIWFFKGAAKDTVTGTVIATHRNILMLQADEEVLNIIMPRYWLAPESSHVISLEEIFGEEGYAPAGTEVTLSVLERTAENEQGVSVTIIFAYLITVDSDSFHAVLPFNID